MGVVNTVFLHTIAVEYTKTSFDDSVKHLRAIENYHHDVNKWSGIGYSWIIDTQGRIFEGRGSRVSGAHTQGHNSTAYGVAFFGHGDKQAATNEQVEAFKALLRYLVLDLKVLKENYIVRGHREVSPKSCPGNLIWPLVQKGIWSSTNVLESIPVTLPSPLIEVSPMVSVQHLYLEAFGRMGNPSEISYWEGEIARLGDSAIKELAVYSNEAKENADNTKWVIKLAKNLDVEEAAPLATEYLNARLMTRVGIVDSFLVAALSKKVTPEASVSNNNGTTVIVQADKKMIIDTITKALQNDL